MRFTIPESGRYGELESCLKGCGTADLEREANNSPCDRVMVVLMAISMLTFFTLAARVRVVRLFPRIS